MNNIVQHRAIGATRRHRTRRTQITNITPRDNLTSLTYKMQVNPEGHVERLEERTHTEHKEQVEQPEQSQQ